MNEWWLLIALLVILLILTIIFIILRKSEIYIRKTMEEVVEKSKNYFQELQVYQDRYLEYIEFNGSNIDYALKKENDFDPLSKVVLKKHYKFFKDKILYYFNDNLSIKVETIKENGKNYFILNDKLKTLGVYVSFRGNNHIVVKYKINYVGSKFFLEIDNSEVDVNEEK